MLLVLGAIMAVLFVAMLALFCALVLFEEFLM